MTLLPAHAWAPGILALALFVDALLSLRPLGFIRDCLEGVGFPEEWWWTLIVIKTLAAAGLLAGIAVPGVAAAANVGVIVYFLCAAVAHVRAGFTGMSFWANCLGMLTLSVGVLVISVVG